MHAVSVFVTVVVLGSLVSASAGLYLLPVLIGWLRKVPDLGSVAVVNVLLGWTLIGWAAALAMALRSVPPPPGPVVQIVQNLPGPPPAPPGSPQRSQPPGPAPAPRRLPAAAAATLPARRPRPGELSRPGPCATALSRRAAHPAGPAGASTVPDAAARDSTRGPR